jgi:TP901 family phage tail tape measure protein
MENEGNAILSFQGKDDGLTQILEAGSSGFENLTQAVSGTTDGFANLEKGSGVFETALKRITGMVGRSRSAFDLLGNSADTVGDSFSFSAKATEISEKGIVKMAASALGLGKQVGFVNTVLGPMGDLWRDVDEASGGAQKGFAVINAISKPLSAGLSTASKFAANLAGQMGILGTEGEEVSNVLMGVSKTLAKLSTGVKLVDFIGDAARLLESVKSFITEDIPALVEGLKGIKETADKLGVTAALFGTKMQTLRTVATVFSSVTGLLQKIGLVGKVTLKTYSDFFLKFMEIKELVGLVNNLHSALRNASLQMQGLNDATSAFEAIGIDTSMAQLAIKVGAVGEGLIGNAQACREFANAAISSFAKVQDQLSYLQTLSTAASESQEGLFSSLSDLTKGPLKNAVDVTQAASSSYYAMSAGADSLSQSNLLLTATTKGAIAGQTDQGAAINAVTNAMNPFRISFRDTDKIMGQFFAATEAGQLSMGNLTGAIGELSGAAKSANVPLSEVLGMYATLTKTGPPGESATRLGNLLQDVTVVSGDAKDELDKLGIRVDKFAIQQKGLLPILEEIFAKSGGNDARLKKIFSNDYSMQAAKSLIVNAGDAKKIMKEVGSAGAETLDKMFDTRQQSLVAKGTSLMNGFKDVMADFGQRVLPIINSGVDVLQNVLKGFQQMPEWQKVFIAGIVTTTIVAERSVDVFGNLSSIILGLGKSYLVARGFMLLTTGQLLVEAKAVYGLVIAEETRIAGLLRLIGVETAVTNAQGAAIKTQGLFAVTTRLLNAEIKLSNISFAGFGQLLKSGLSSGAGAAASSFSLIGSALSALRGGIVALYKVAIPFLPVLLAIAAAFAAFETGKEVLQLLGLIGSEFEQLEKEITKTDDAFLQFSSSVGEAKKTIEKPTEKKTWFDQFRENLGLVRKDTDEFTGFINTKVLPLINLAANAINSIGGIGEKDGKSNPLTSSLLKALPSLLPGGAGTAVNIANAAVDVGAGTDKNTKERKTIIDDYFLNFKKSRQAKLDAELNAIYENGDRLTNDEIDRTRKYNAKSKKGQFISADASQLFGASQDEAKARGGSAIAGEDFKKILETEQAALDQQIKINDRRVEDLTKQLNNPQTRKARKEVIQEQIKQLKAETSALEENNRAKERYLGNLNAITQSIDENNASTSSKKVIEGLVNQQEDLNTQSGGKKRGEYRQLFGDVMAGMNNTGISQRRSNSQLLTAIKNFEDNAIQINGSGGVKKIEELVKMQQDADTLRDAVVKGAGENISYQLAQQLLQRIGNQEIDIDVPEVKDKSGKVTQPGIKAKGKILTGDQQQMLVQSKNDVNQKSVELNAAKIQQKVEDVNLDESKGNLLSGQAQQKRLGLQIEINQERLKNAQATEKLIVENYGKNSPQYIKAVQDRRNIERQIEKDSFDKQLAADNYFTERRIKLREQAISRIKSAEDQQRFTPGQSQIAMLGEEQKIQVLQASLIRKRMSRMKDTTSDAYKDLQMQLEQSERDGETKRFQESRAREDYALDRRVKNYEQAIEEIKLSETSLQRTQFESTQAVFEQETKINEERLKLADNRLDAARVRTGENSDVTKDAEIAVRQLEREQESRRIQIERAKVVRDIEVEQQRSTNSIEVQNQLLKAQINQVDLITARLQQQQELVDSRNSLIQSVNAGLTAQLDLVQKLVTDEILASKIQATAASTRLTVLIQSRKIEQDNLVRQQKQKELAFTRQQLDLENSKLANERSIQEENFNYRKLEATQKLTGEQVQQHQLALSVLNQQTDLLAGQEDNLKQNVAAQSELNSNAREELQIRQTQAKNGGVMDVLLAKQTGMTAQLSKEIDILQKRQDFAKTAVDNYSNQLNLLSQTTNSELEKRDIAAAIAAIKLNSLSQQQEMERKVLDLQIRQKEAVLEQEKSRIRIMEAENKSQIAGAKGSILDAMESGKSGEQVQARVEVLKGYLEASAAMKAASLQLEDRGAYEKQLSAFEKASQVQSQITQRSSAQMELASNLPMGAQRNFKEFIRGNLLRQMGVGERNIMSLGDVTAGQQMRAGYSNGGMYVPMPEITIPKQVDYEKIRKDVLSQLGEFVPPSKSPAKAQSETQSATALTAMQEQMVEMQKQLKKGAESASAPSSVDQKNTFNVYLPAGSTKQQADDLKEPFYKIQKDLWEKVRREMN